MRSGFARLHPLVDLTFFVLVLAFAMFLSHPAVQLAGLVCAALFALRCTGRGFGRRMAMLLPLMLLAAVVNPLVSHQGVTVLFRFPSGNACTLESRRRRSWPGPRRAAGWRASAAPVASCPSWSPGHWKMPSTRRTP